MKMAGFIFYFNDTICFEVCQSQTSSNRHCELHYAAEIGMSGTGLSHCFANAPKVALLRK
jgi:hypothetical protein